MYISLAGIFWIFINIFFKSTEFLNLLNLNIWNYLVIELSSDMESNASLVIIILRFRSEDERRGKIFQQN